MVHYRVIFPVILLGQSPHSCYRNRHDYRLMYRLNVSGRFIVENLKKM